MKCPPHPAERVSLRRKRAVGGGEAIVRQCAACGQRVGYPLTQKQIDAAKIDMRKLPLWDARLARRPQPTKRKRDFAARFKKKDWCGKGGLRDRVRARDNYTCRNCGEYATDAHHLTYERFEEERLEDLAASCSDCNRAEREKRMMGGA